LEVFLVLLGTYRFHCRFETPAFLPAYKGSTFRGVFGHALKEVVCAIGKTDCTDYLAGPQCLCHRVFETPARPPGRLAGRTPSPPHPFVIEPPPLERKTFGTPGDQYDLQLWCSASSIRFITFHFLQS
jgi:hypothetical protein